MNSRIKKTLIFTIAVIGLASQAYANSGRGKPEGARRAETDRVAREAAKQGTTQSTAADLVRSLDRTNLARLSPSQSRDLESLISSNSQVRAAAEDIVANSTRNELTSLNSERLEALSNLKDVKTDATADAVAALNPVARAEQGYVTLALSAAAKARDWSPSTRENLTFVLTAANNYVKQGVSRGDALIRASRDLETQKGIKLNIDDISKLCK